MTDPHAASGDPGGDGDRQASVDLKRRVFQGVFWFGSSSLLRALLRLAVMVVLARLLTPHDFGLVGAASIFIAFAELFSTTGIVYTMVQRKELDQRHISVGFTSSLVSGLLTGAAILVLAPRIAGFFRIQELEQILAVLALLFPLSSVSDVSQKLLERNLAYGRLAAIEVASYFFGYGLVAITLAWAGWGVWALVYAILGAAAVRCLLLLASQKVPIRPSFHWGTYVELMRTGLGFSLARFGNFFAQKGDYFVVGRWLGAAPLGLYERSYVLMDLSNSLLTNSLNTVLFPAFAKLQGDHAKMAQAFCRASAALSLIFLPAGVAASLLAPEIVGVLLGA